MRPNRSTACSTTCATSSCTVQSAGTASASEPEASISRTQASSASVVRAVTTTLAPRLPARRATARPSPLDAPVTTTTCSESGFLRIQGSDHRSSRPGNAATLASRVTGWTSPTHIILLLLIALLLFGAKRLPEIRRSLGTGMREFKDSVSGNDKTEQPELPPPDTTTTTTSAAPPERDTV